MLKEEMRKFLRGLMATELLEVFCAKIRNWLHCEQISRTPVKIMHPILTYKLLNIDQKYIYSTS